METCDKCSRKAKYLWLCPYLYKMEGDARADERGYVQYRICGFCYQEERRRRTIPRFYDERIEHWSITPHLKDNEMMYLSFILRR